MSTRDLTPKQLHFSRCVASGMTQADAYREAYNVSDKTKASSIHQSASKLMADPKVRERVEALVRARDKALAARALSDREAVLSKLRHMMESAEPSDGVKLRAAELLGKSVGLFKDVVENHDHRSVSDVDAELEALLQQASEQQVTDADMTTEGDMPEDDSTVH